MKTYKNIITLNKNSRGCYILDTVKGCLYLNKRLGGCYNNCYAAAIAKRYGFDFSSPVLRAFINNKHKNKIIKQIENSDMPFIRIGESGDPSFNWDHTINICKIISEAQKTIVIVTKHFNEIPGYLLKEIDKLDLCINTSISALDTDIEIQYRLKQYNKLKTYCNSVLRVVTCNFNKKNELGLKKHEIQKVLLNNDKVLETIFRPKKDNNLIRNNIIKCSKKKFLKSEVLVSLNNENIYFGTCENCNEMCGTNL